MKRAIWQYECDSRWEFMLDSLSSAIEVTRAAGGDCVALGQYKYDNQSMKQTNLDTGKVRNIRRIMADNESTWEYTDENGQWVPMSGSMSRLICISEALGEVIVKFKQYSLDLSRNIQTNIATNKERSIRKVSVGTDHTTLWEFEGDKSWDAIPARASTAIQDAVRQGASTVTCGKYSYDLQAMTQTNTATQTEREIRCADPDWDIPWEHEHDDGSWQPVAAATSAAIQDAVRRGQASAAVGGDTFDLVAMTRTSAGRRAASGPGAWINRQFWLRWVKPNTT
jgi:hypothetical protein